MKKASIVVIDAFFFYIIQLKVNFVNDFCRKKGLFNE